MSLIRDSKFKIQNLEFRVNIVALDYFFAFWIDMRPQRIMNSNFESGVSNLESSKIRDFPPFGPIFGQFLAWDLDLRVLLSVTHKILCWKVILTHYLV